MRVNFETMPVDDLWRLYQEIGVALAQQLTVEKSKLEERLNQLRGEVARSSERQRRPYPKVQAKFQNPDDASQTWSGRGKKPRWVTQMLTAGKSLEELLVGQAVA